MAHSYTKLLYHLVFSTIERRPLITKTLRPLLYDYLGGAVRGLDGVAIEIGGVADHVHLLVRMPRTIAVDVFLQKLKANSSGWVTRTQAVKFNWQRGFGAFTVSESQVEKVRRYIQNQEAHHSKVSFEEEFKAILKAHKVEFDEEYLWR
jgi:REP element-mobilizing transposase RayT